jgi:hypothetical protein
MTMAVFVDDSEITDHSARFLLRYFRAAAEAGAKRPYVDAARDRDLLRLHWAFSPVVRDLAIYVLQHRHEIQSMLSTTRRIEDGMVRGRIDARATLLHRRMTGLTTAMVSDEPLRSYHSGPNQVLIWVLMQAWSLGMRFTAMLPASASYRETVTTNVQTLEQVRRIQAIGLIAADTLAAKRPGASALLEAGRSRREIYRRARDAYEALLRIEAGDPETIATLLRHTLLAPLETWRRYELAIAFSVAEALAASEGGALTLNLLMGDTSIPIARVGRYAVYWQSRTDLYRPPEIEPSEQVVRNILAAYSLSASSDRPDLVVIDNDRRSVAAVIEVKYLTAEDASDRVRSAVEQLVRYARLYHPIEETGPLLGRSLVAVSQGLEGLVAPEPLPADVPMICDFASIRQGQLGAWAERLRH